MNHSLNGEGYVLHEECLDPCFFGNSESLSDSTQVRQAVNNKFRVELEVEPRLY